MGKTGVWPNISRSIHVGGRYHGWRRPVDTFHGGKTRNTNEHLCRGTRSHMLWYDGYELAYIHALKYTAACEMHDCLYNRMVFTIL